MERQTLFNLEESVATLTRYENELYLTFYCDGPAVEKHLPNLPFALSLYNGFFRKIYLEHKGQIKEADLIRSFTKFIYGLTGRPHFIFVRHYTETSFFHCEGELWNNSRSMEKAGKPFLWQEYEIDIADTKHKNMFDIEITLAHELVHIVEENLRLQK